VFGDGAQTRCFCHVDDVVGALVDLMLLGDGAYGEVFNIGSQEEISILSLADRVRGLTASDSDIVLVPYEEAYEAGFEDMPRRVPEVSKIGAAVGWTPTRSLDEILADVINFQQAEAAVV
jgi:UDP-glucose 4-epimerase